MKNFKLVISSPEGKIYDGNTVRLSVRGIEGELAIMAGVAKEAADRASSSTILS